MGAVRADPAPTGPPARTHRSLVSSEPMLAAATFSLAVAIIGTALLTTVLYRREKSNRQALEQQSDSQFRVLTKRIARDTERGDRVLRISSAEMAVFLRQRPPLADGTEDR